VASSGLHDLDILVENMGRINFGRAQDFLQHKGIVPSERAEENFYIHDTLQYEGFEIFALEFDSDWVQRSVFFVISCIKLYGCVKTLLYISACQTGKIYPPSN